MIDRGALDRLQEWGGPKLVSEMIRLFLENSPERLGQMRLGFDQGELKAVERAAHSLKSTAANVGALDVSRLAERMEDLAEAGEEEEAKRLYGELTLAHQHACQQLEQFQEGANA